MLASILLALVFVALCIIERPRWFWLWISQVRRRRKEARDLDRLIDPARKAGVVSYIEDARRRRAL